MVNQDIGQRNKVKKGSPKQNLNCQLHIYPSLSKQFAMGGIESKIDFLVKCEQRRTQNELRSDYEKLVAFEYGISLSEYLDSWLSRYKTRTGSDYRSICKNHIKPGLGHYRLKDLTRDRIQTWIDGIKSVKKVGVDEQPLELSSTTKRHVIKCLHKALEDAIPDKLEHNPADKVVVPPDEDEGEEGK